MEITVTESSGDSFTIAVKGHFIGRPSGFTETKIPVGQFHIFSRNIGTGSQAEIRTALESWIKNQAVRGIHDLNLSRGTTITVTGHVNVKVRMPEERKRVSDIPRVPRVGPPPR